MLVDSRLLLSYSHLLLNPTFTRLPPIGDGVAGGPKVDSLRELRPKGEDDPNEESNPEAPNPEAPNPEAPNPEAPNPEVLNPETPNPDEPSPTEELKLGLRVFSLPPFDTAL